MSKHNMKWMQRKGEREGGIGALLKKCVLLVHGTE